MKRAVSLFAQTDRQTETHTEQNTEKHTHTHTHRHSLLKMFLPLGWAVVRTSGCVCVFVRVCALTWDFSAPIVCAEAAPKRERARRRRAVIMFVCVCVAVCVGVCGCVCVSA